MVICFAIMRTFPIEGNEPAVSWPVVRKVSFRQGAARASDRPQFRLLVVYLTGFIDSVFLQRPR
jgi:hypothetical protein